jgi:hypothetical protein
VFCPSQQSEDFGALFIVTLVSLHYFVTPVSTVLPRTSNHFIDVSAK